MRFVWKEEAVVGGLTRIVACVGCISTVRTPQDAHMKEIDQPCRVQDQVNESFGFEVSLDAVVLFDDRD